MSKNTSRSNNSFDKPCLGTLVYPGSFDPITLGHIDLLKRACRLFDNIIFAISDASVAKNFLFSLEERVAMASQVVQDEGLENIVSVEGFSNLLMDFMKQKQAKFILRGLRTVTDFEFEFQLANVNRMLYPDIETVFLMPDEGFAYISSSLVREISLLDGDISKLVPPSVAKSMMAKVKTKKTKNIEGGGISFKDKKYG